ncbi:MAG: hypothetical protein Q7V31_13195 [Parvibaculum sp.]|uniref:hypothetical protein n=1 Tax=Parvibaculum sp. TaxID=2024848 RepID=UPI00271AE4B6|nr:hypothetical protein [Parvibaculum sp.]MDO8839875.1 hypothetical protein [Parvibaculum sp.]
MSDHTRILKMAALSAVLAFATVAQAAAAGFPDGPSAVHLIVEPDQQLEQTLTASVGDVVYSDTRIAAYRRIIVNGDMRGICANGICHNVPAGEEYVPIPYGMSLYCTKGTYAERKSLFSKHQDHSCIKLTSPGNVTNIEMFSIGSFDDQLRIVPQPVNIGNYLRLNDERLDSLPEGISGGWTHFFEPVQIVYLGASEGRIRFRIESRTDASHARVISYPYQGGPARLPMSGVNPMASDTDYEKISFGGTDEEVTGVTMNVETADLNAISYNLKEVTFVRQFMGSTISLSQGDTTISLQYGTRN